MSGNDCEQMEISFAWFSLKAYKLFKNSLNLSQSWLIKCCALPKVWEFLSWTELCG
jgi:hypothetical protein